LAHTIRKLHPDWKEGSVDLFTSPFAAKYFNPSGIDNPGRYRWGRQFRASYEFDEDKHEEYLVIMPLGYNEDYLGTRMSLPLRGKPDCRLGVAGRCLLAADDIAYPIPQATGTVVLTGTIQGGGAVRDLRVAEADVHPPARRNVLSKWAFKSLKSWQFDAGEHNDPIRLTFSYVIDASLPRGAPPRIEWALPNQVTIRGNPPG
jgi:hypothetical protein